MEGTVSKEQCFIVWCFANIIHSFTVFKLVKLHHTVESEKYPVALIICCFF